MNQLEVAALLEVTELENLPLLFRLVRNTEAVAKDQAAGMTHHPAQVTEDTAARNPGHPSSNKFRHPVVAATAINLQPGQQISQVVANHPAATAQRKSLRSQMFPSTVTVVNQFRFLPAVVATVEADRASNNKDLQDMVASKLLQSKGQQRLNQKVIIADHNLVQLDTLAV